MLPNHDTLPFCLVCFIIAQGIYTCLESFVKGTFLRLQRKAVINSKSKSEFPVKYSFDLCVHMKQVWNTCIHAIWSQFLQLHLECGTELCTLSEQLAFFVSILFSHRHLFTKWRLFKSCSQDRIISTWFFNCW